MTLGLQREKASYKKEIEPTGIIHRENILLDITTTKFPC